MSDQRENLSVPNDQNDGRLKITIEELQGLWEKVQVRDTDRMDGEFTKAEAAEMWGIPEDTAYDRIMKMVKADALTKRSGRRNGRKMIYYQASK